MAEPDKAKSTPEEREIWRRLAKAIWIVQEGSELPQDNAARKEAWAEVKKDRIGKARRICRQINRAGISLSLSEVEETE